ncbi:unnamed protein product [Sympodiomycopsis kandeliae]
MSSYNADIADNGDLRIRSPQTTSQPVFGGQRVLTTYPPRSPPISPSHPLTNRRATIVARLLYIEGRRAVALDSNNPYVARCHIC